MWIRMNYGLATVFLLISCLFFAGCTDDNTKPGHDTVTDYDGNIYQTSVIGNQEWMTENLRVTRYNNGDPIPTGLGIIEWENTTTGAYAIYDHGQGSADGINSPQEMVEAYGKLYNWFAVVDSRGLCPEGWRIPTDDDWTELINFATTQGYPNERNSQEGAGNAIKSCRQIDSPSGGDCSTSVHPRWESDAFHYGLDIFGFAALSGGSLWPAGFFFLGTRGYFWSSTEYSNERAWLRYVYNYRGDVAPYYYDKNNGYSVRCVR